MKGIIYLLLPFLLFFLIPDGTAETHISKLQNEVSRSRQWLRLLHYKERSILSGYVSFADNPEFFISPQGKTDPLAELQASLAALKNPKTKTGFLNQPFECSFPARAKFLKSRFSIQTPRPSCPDYDEWKQNMSSVSVSYVFSTSYPNNPASLFGHTMLRFHKETKPGYQDLLDTAVTFAADVDESRLGVGIIYILSGLFGWYDGLLGLSRYYENINTYNQHESRDLWEYELDLTPEELDRLEDHVWEVYANARFDYFFIDENCSYRLLAILEVAKTDWNLTQSLWTYYLPSDTLKLILQNRGAVKSVRFRPSIKKQFLARFNSLSENERAELLKDIRSQNPSSQKPEVIEALAAYYDYFKRKRGDADAEKLLRKTLTHRARLRGTSTPREFHFDKSNRPDWGHHSSNIALGILNRDTSPVLFFRLEGGLHDLLNSDLGYERFSQIEGVSAELHFQTEKQKVAIDQIKLIEMTSIHPLEQLDNQFSWHLSLGFDTLKVDTIGDPCRYCHAFGFTFGVGQALWLLSPTWVGVLSATANFQASPRVEKGYRLGPGARLQLIASPTSSWKLLAQGDAIFNWIGENTSSLRYRYSGGTSLSFNQSWETRLLFDLLTPSQAHSNFYREIALEIDYYFL